MPDQINIAPIVPANSADEKDERHFNKIFWFVVGLSTLIISYIIALSFRTIPPSGSHIVDTTLGFLLSILSAAIGYLIGGNPTLGSGPKKAGTGTVTADISATVSSDTDSTDTSK